MAAQGESDTIPAVVASEGSAVGATPGNPDGESAQKARAAIDAEILDAVAGITAEAQRAGPSTFSEAGDKMGSALNDLTAIAEKIRKGWSAV